MAIDCLSQSSKRVAPSWASSTGDQGALAELGAEVRRVRVGDDLAWVVAGAEAVRGRARRTELLGAADLEDRR